MAAMRCHDQRRLVRKQCYKIVELADTVQVAIRSGNNPAIETQLECLFRVDWLAGTFCKKKKWIKR